MVSVALAVVLSSVGAVVDVDLYYYGFPSSNIHSSEQ